MSETLQTKVIEAHEKLWARVLELNDLPSPYGTALGYLMLLTPDEMDSYQKNPKFPFSTSDEGFDAVVLGDRRLGLIRPYIDDRLWESTRSRIAFTLRLLIMMATDHPTGTALSGWHEDGLLLTHLSTTFQDATLNSFDYTKPGIIHHILDAWDGQIVTMIKKAHSQLQS